MEKMQSVQGIVLKISRIYGQTAEDREDLFQEIVLNAWKSYGGFRGNAKFSTWLYRVALNTALMHKRHSASRMATTRCRKGHPCLGRS